MNGDSLKIHVSNTQKKKIHDARRKYEYECYKFNLSNLIYNFFIYPGDAHLGGKNSLQDI